jgi:fatty-acyl-CoA synthase
MSKDREGYIYFIDRIGDTFRWKGENVATNEVAEALSQYPGITTANVYGVAIENMDGRAGMASITTEKEFSIDGLRAYLTKALPPYAVPLFIRLQSEAETTGTFKYRKVELVEEGFDVTKVSDPIWFLNPEQDTFAPLKPAEYKLLQESHYRL